MAPTKLVVKIMSEKINKKYGKSLTRDQKTILQEYVFSISEDTDERICSRLNEIKNKSISDLDNFKLITNNSVLLEKISDVKEKILLESADDISDESISRFLVLVKLREEIKEALNE